MVSFRDQIPDELESAEDKEAIIQYLRQVHGDIEDAKVTLLFLADELGFEVSASDIESVTDAPPTETFT
jgi:hypothetical protein